MMSWLVRQYDDPDYSEIAALHDVIYPAYQSQPDSWHAAAQFDYIRSKPDRYVVLDKATQHVIGYSAIRSIRSQNARIDLMIHPAWQRQGIGRALFDQIIDHARTLNIVAVHMRARLDYPHVLSFLTHRGFTETHRMYGLRLTLKDIDLTPWWPMVERVRARGIVMTTLAQEREHNPTYLHQLHELQNAVSPDWPDPERVPFTPVSFADFMRRLKQETQARPEALFIAKHNSAYVGYCGLETLGTAVHPDYRNQGVATALKITAIADAKRQGYATVFTSTANSAMLAINKKLGYQHVLVEVRLGKPIR